MNVKGFKTLDEFLNESRKGDGFVVSYSGKFQPFHYGHYDIYQLLVKKFGKENVYITTADLNPKHIGKSDYDDNHFLTFDEKKSIMTDVFKIPASKVVKVANPYSPKELTGMFTEDTAYITVLGKKDAERLSKGKYFEMYSDDIELKGYREEGYIWAQENSSGIKQSATDVRNMFRSDISDKEKEKQFKKFYGGKFDAKIFNMLNSKLNATKVNECAPPIPGEEWNGIGMRPLHSFHPLAAETMQEFAKTHKTFKFAINEGGAFGHLEHIYDDFALSFKDLKELVNLALSGKLENAVEKCVHEDMEIILEKHGRMKIKDVVDNMIVDKVLSYDHTLDEIKFNDILDYASNGEETEWIEIATEHNKVLVTANHRVYVEGLGDVKAEDLTEDMIIVDL